MKNHKNLNPKKKPLVFLVCTGLGHINRGYESFSKECFEAIKNNGSFDLCLLKGAGKSVNKEIALPNFHRNGRVAKALSRLLHKESYHIEQISFLVFFFPLIIIKKPEVIYYSDFILGTYLWHLRNFFKFKYKLLFSNGAPNGPPFKTEDHVQQLLPVHLDYALKKGEPISKQTLLPYGFDIDVQQRIEALKKKEIIRKQMFFLPEHEVVLSVGAINKSHKRIDYLIEEISKLNSNFFLIVLGQTTEETDELKTMAETKLKGRYKFLNLPYEEIKDYYTAADYFVLASLHEGFPRVSIEALSFGLPCIVHDYAVMRQVFEETGIFVDMKIEGELSKNLSAGINKFNKIELINKAYNLYSWDKLKNRYTDMILNQISQN